MRAGTFPTFASVSLATLLVSCGAGSGGGGDGGLSRILRRLVPGPWALKHVTRSTGSMT